MWFDGIRQPNTLYVASVSRGKDSTAMLRAIQLMNWPLDAIVSVDIWFDEETPAELPPLVKFKDEWDTKCLDWVGVPVTRVCATKRDREPQDGECFRRETYTGYFYKQRSNGKFIGANIGFPMQQGSWCKKLKYEQVDLYGHILSACFAEERDGEGDRDGLHRRAPSNGLLRTQSKSPFQKECFVWIPSEKGSLVQRTSQSRSPRQRFHLCPKWTRGKR